VSRITCSICPHHCALAPGQIGLCRARGNVDGKVTAVNYGLVTAAALDPIEKKPLYHFYPSSMILSLGSFGCNLHCPFCQNFEIAAVSREQTQVQSLAPEHAVELAETLKNRGNIGLAYTYNEPLVGYEYVYDCSVLAKKRGLKNVLVSNGFCCREPLAELLPLIDAVNFDLKAFNDQFYQKIGGDLETVKASIELAAGQTHLEVTTLIIPGENDSEEEIRELARWLASIRRDIPLHLSRFFPRHKYADRNPTDVMRLKRLAETARSELEHVYLGNV
jgi:pyruvate formate lyase activating enzyme